MLTRVIGNEQARALVSKSVMDLPTDGSMTVVIKKTVSKRSVAQNALMWTWFRSWGQEAGYTDQEMHDALCERILGCDVYRTLNGELRERPKGTSGLSTGEMSDFLAQVERLAAEMGVYLERPEDTYYKAMGMIR